ncbi:hypothetical protein DH96_01260 [Candidatus Phytoplasma oryzae]|nr:ribonuclease HIII [Candidatus Phytoplasma oryzae]RAM57917.1 hypothetical protein DH96_01260 [Candidatus Phytoplasma oryzae]
MKKYYSLKLNFDQIQIIKNKFQNFIINNLNSKNKHIYFIIKKDNDTITIFNSGICLIQGKKIEKNVLLIFNILNLNIKDINLDSKSLDIFAYKNFSFFSNEEYDNIGSDEVGTGDVFGPVVVCAVFIDKKKKDFFHKINIRDSKKISSERIFKIANLIINHKIPYIVKILNPPQYNLLIRTNNLNKIKALMHNKAILDLLILLKKKDVCVIVDQFVSPKNYFNYLQKEKKVHKLVIFKTKAESHYLSVALASIIARYFFLKEIEKLSKNNNINLKLGASSVVDQQILEIYNKKNISVFNQIAKCNFKNIKKILSDKKLILVEEKN